MYIWHFNLFFLLWSLNLLLLFVLFIREKKKKLLAEHRLKKSTAESRPIVPRRADKDREFTLRKMEGHLASLGIDPSAAVDRARSRSKSRGRKRERSIGDPADDMEIDGMENKNKRLRSRSRSKSRAVVEASPGEGFKDTEQKKKAIKLGKKAVRQRNNEARKGEADRQIVNVRPKHLFSGKRGAGKTDRR